MTTAARANSRVVQTSLSAARAFLALLVASACTLGAARATPNAKPHPGIYVGSIGPYPIVAAFGIALTSRGDETLPATIDGMYFYRNVGTSIAFEGAPDGAGRIVLRELVESPESFRAVPSGDVWNVRVDGDRIAGTWCHACAHGAAGHALEVRLVRVAALGSRASIADDEDRYHGEMLRRPLVRSGEHAGGASAAYVTLTDDRFGATSIELTKLANEAARVAANRVFANDLRANRLAAFDCGGEGRYGAGGVGSWHERLAVSYWSATAISLDERFSYNCGGPYPTDDESAPLTVDLRTGRALDWSRAFVSGSAETLRRAYLKRVADTPNHAASADLETVDYTYWFTRGGLAMRPDFPHVLAAANLTVILPFADIRPLLARDVRPLVP